MSGVESIEEIARQSSTDVEKVKKVIEAQQGYGLSPYDTTPYGNTRAVSNNGSAVSRRTTVRGQLSYRGHRYSLGAPYRGRIVQVCEKANDLLILCAKIVRLFMLPGLQKSNAASEVYDSSEGSQII